MKKLFCFLAIGAMTLTSCSSSDDDSNSSGVILLKKTIDTYDDGTVVTSNATYNGTKIKKITADDGFTIDFTYSGDLITKMEYKLGGTPIQTDLYAYDGNQRLISYIRQEPQVDWGSKELYTYNNDGTVTIMAYSGDVATQTTFDGSGTITFLPNGEVSTITSTFGDSHTYTYDNKNNPFKNVTGYDKVSWVDTSASGINHNIVGEVMNFDTINTTYTYNSDNFPTQAVEIDTDGETFSTQFFY